MYFFTHLIISKVLYQHFSTELELDKQAFAYGNIKPDLPSSHRNHHTLENCLFTVCDYSNILINDKKSTKNQSILLGEICHYVCDFFCYYHINEEIHNKKLHHFLYELNLHHKLLQIRFMRKLKIFPSEMEPIKGMHSIILEMRKAYFSQSPCRKRDIDFAFLTSVWVCESILYFMKYSSDPAKEVELARYSLLTTDGSSL